jgi:cell division protein FtsB
MSNAEGEMYRLEEENEILKAQVERLESLVKKITYDQSTVELGYGEQVVFNIAYPMGGTVHKEVQDVWKTKDEGVPMIDRVSRDLEKYESLVKDDKWSGQILMSVASLREIKATERELQSEVESLREENESLKEEIISLQEDNAGESI